MTDSHDRVSGPRPEGGGRDERAVTDPDALTFFESEPAASVTTGGTAGGGLEGDATGTPGPNAGYTGGLAEGTQGAAGMRQVVVDEATEARARGEDAEPPANLAQQDQ